MRSIQHASLRFAFHTAHPSYTQFLHGCKQRRGYAGIAAVDGIDWFAAQARVEAASGRRRQAKDCGWLRHNLTIVEGTQRCGVTSMVSMLLQEKYRVEFVDMPAHVCSGTFGNTSPSSSHKSVFGKGLFDQFLPSH